MDVPYGLYDINIDRNVKLPYTPVYYEKDDDYTNGYKPSCQTYVCKPKGTT